MRVLWFATSSINPKLAKHGYNGGGWVAELQEELKKKGVTMALASYGDFDETKYEYDGYTYYFIKKKKRSFFEKLNNLFNPRTMKYEKRNWPFYISQMNEIIADYKPDIIQVFGTEQRYGLISAHTDVPVVIHLQGILSAYQYAFLIPGVSLLSYCFLNFNLKKVWSRYQICEEWYRETEREREIIGNCKYFIGRTEWDKACITSLCKNLHYYYGSEILRKVFYDSSQRIQPSILTIITTSSGALYKGFDIVLNTAKILKDQLHVDFIWKVFGDVNPKFYESLTEVRHEDVNIELCGVVNAQQLKDALLECTLYFHPSYIENSPNSVCEAQICGCPVVACYVGGVGNLVHHKEDGFLIPANDPFMGAYRILQLYNDKTTNKKMGEKAKIIALKRHDRKKIVEEILEIYKDVIG